MNRYYMMSVSALTLALAFPASQAGAQTDASGTRLAQATGVAAPENAGRAAKGKIKGRCEDGTKPPCLVAAPAASEAATAGDAAQVQEQPPVPATTDAEPVDASSAETAQPPANQVPQAEVAKTAHGQKKLKAGDTGEVASGDAPVPAADAPSDATAVVEPQPVPATTGTEPQAAQPDAAVVEVPPAAAEPAETATKRVRKVLPQTDATTEQPATTDSAGQAVEQVDQQPGVEAPVDTAQRKRRTRTDTTDAAAAEVPPAPVESTTETVTEVTTRTSREDVARPPARQSEKDRSNDLAKILGAAAAGVIVGVVVNEALHGGGTLVETTGDRAVVERDGRYFVRKDEYGMLRRPGYQVRTDTFHDGSSRMFVDRPDGGQVITIRDADGYVVQRVRILPDGRRIVLFDDTRAWRDDRTAYNSRDRAWISEDQLPRYDSGATHQRRYVDYGRADRQQVRDVLTMRPIANIDRSYTLRQVRENWQLRDAMPRLDLDVISFDTGSAAITTDQAGKLDALGWAMKDILDQRPDEVFLIEGHTDAVGSRISNLVLSDRRAETVALALSEYYDIPPENMITQGYGEEFLKIDTQGPERANRRTAVRRITPLLDRADVSQ